MNPDQRELFEQIILDHNEHPRNFKKLENPTHSAEGYNPICGDRYSVYLSIRDGVIGEASFHGHGCALSKASASIMTALLPGKSLQDAEALFDQFHRLITGPDAEEPSLETWGDIAVLFGVRKYPNRVKCVNLSWHALKGALDESGSVTTE